MESEFKIDPMLIAQRNTEALLRMHSQIVEKEVLSQLSELVKRGLLRLEMGQLALAQEQGELKIVQMVRLTLRDKEYIENLEKENKELREIHAKLQGVLK